MTLTSVPDLTKTWKRLPPRAVEVVIFQVGVKHAWVLRYEDTKTAIDEGVEKTFRMAALSAELAEFRHKNAETVSP